MSDVRCGRSIASSLPRNSGSTAYHTTFGKARACRLWQRKSGLSNKCKLKTTLGLLEFIHVEFLVTV